MNCLECQELLQKRMDGAAALPAELLEAHLNQCTACREQHACAVSLLDGLALLPQPRPAANFARSMVAQVMHDRRHRQQKTRRRVFVTMALAASLLFTLMVAYYWLPRSANGNLAPKDILVKDTPKKEVTPPRQEAKVIPKKEEPRNVFSALTDRWADTTREHAKVLAAAAKIDAIEKLPAVGELPEAGQEVSDGVQAVTRNARKAFDFFARELPMPDMGDSKN
jgi:hypothetical protein